MRDTRKTDKLQRRLQLRQQQKKSLEGTGRYVYKVAGKGDLTLAKPASDGRTTIQAGGTFESDSYYQTAGWVGPPLRLLLLMENKSEPLIEEKKMDKLILDQPDQITNEGKIEHIAKSEPQVKLNDSAGSSAQKPVDKLLTEHPLDGVEIILG